MVVNVLTVPMRNGNKVEPEKKEMRGYGSYRTYEEWKPLSKRYKSHIN